MQRQLKQETGVRHSLPAEQIRQEVLLPWSVLHIQAMALKFQRPSHEFRVIVAHCLNVAERRVVSPHCHRCCAELGSHGSGQRESLLLNRAVVPLEVAEFAAQVTYRMLPIVHNLEQSCTQISLGSINCYREWQVIF